MRCPSAAGLDSLAIRHLLSSPANGRARILGIAGYPFTGKSRLALEICAAWPSGKVTILPTESAVLPRSLRLKTGVDGCAAQGHDMSLLLNYAISLSNGRSIQCPQYSWISGELEHRITLDGQSSDGLLIIDGTVAAASPIIELCDYVIFLSPKDETLWLPLACHRDVESREWDGSLARSQNLKKAFTSARMKFHAARRTGISVVVDPVSWTWFFPSCNTCDDISQSLDILVKPPVPMLTCKAR